MRPEISYYLVGILPVKYIRDLEKQAFTVKKFDRISGCFVDGDDYLGAISHSTSNVDEVDKDEFIRQLEELRARHFKKADGELKVIYDELRKIIDLAYIEQRRHAAEEIQRIAELSQQSYRLFESTIGCAICGHDERYD